MKKFAALFMALMMLFTMTAMADEAVKSPAADTVPSPGAGDVVEPGTGSGSGSGSGTVTPSPDAPGVVPSPDAPSTPGASVSAPAVADVKVGQVLWAAHGTKCFAIMTVVMQDDVIVAAYIDEFQFMDAATAVGVPNSDADFGASFPEGKVLASKRVNAELYSANMAKAGSTVALDDNYAAIEAFVVGLTIADLEAVLADMTAEAAVDAVSGATLVDTLGYLQGLLAAAKAAQ